MSSRPPPILGVLLLGTSLLALGTLLWWSSGGDDEATSEALVQVRVTEEDGDLIFNGTNLRLERSEATVLGALLEASRIGNFSVEVTYGYFGHAFVTSIAGIENRGQCGWMWDRNEVVGDRAADAQVVESRDEIVWRWGCET